LGKRCYNLRRCRFYEKDTQRNDTESEHVKRIERSNKLRQSKEYGKNKD